jgi:hypothetical protein
VRLYRDDTRGDRAGCLKGMKLRKLRLPKALLVVIVVSSMTCLSLMPVLTSNASEMQLAEISKSEPCSEHFGVVSSHLMLNAPQILDNGFQRRA